MNIEEIRREIDELSILANSWMIGVEPTSIERDIVLSKLSRLYEGVKFMSADLPPKPIVDEVIEAMDPVEEPQAESAEEIVAVVEEEVLSANNPDESIFAFDMTAVSLVDSASVEEPEIEVVPEIEAESESESEPEPEPELARESEPELEPKVELELESEPEFKSEPETEPEQKSSNMLFDIDTIPKSRRRRSVLMSLYDDENLAVDSTPVQTQAPSPTLAPEIIEPVVTKEEYEPIQPKTEPEPEPQPEVEVVIAPTPSVPNFIPPLTQPTIADTLGSGVETVADRLSNIAPRTIFSDYIHYRSFDELGINERYLLSRDLFGDDPQLCREMLAKISSFDNYDDAMIFIAENFNWAPDLEGAKLLLSVLENKFNINY